MHTFIGAPNSTPSLNLPTSEQYKTRNRKSTVTGIYCKTDHEQAV